MGTSAEGFANAMCGRMRTRPAAGKAGYSEKLASSSSREVTAVPVLATTMPLA